MIAYKVGNEFINNVYLALHTSWKTNNPVKFYCLDNIFDLYNWADEPEASLDYLMSDYALRLRDDYERLILMWSGGTDSHTIYNIFKKNNIHIDEIIIKTEKDSIEFPTYMVNWIKENHYDPTTTISWYDNFDTSLRLIDIPDENWVWQNKGDLFKYCMSAASSGVQFLCEKNHAGKKWAVINGFEKPRLVYRDGQWYHRQLGEVFNQAMGSKNLIPFFLEPLIAIKQSHMVKRAVKKLIKDNNLPLYNGDWAETKWPKTHSGYRAWANGCGRHDELIIGTSSAQKQLNQRISNTEININGSWKILHHSNDIRLAQDLAQEKTTAVNYVKGFLNLYHEPGFVDFLQSNNWFRVSDQCFTSLNFIWSKEYNLGP